jgi:hypothetical protein
MWQIKCVLCFQALCWIAGKCVLCFQQLGGEYSAEEAENFIDAICHFPLSTAELDAIVA